MFTGTPEELKRREAEARLLAKKVAELLTQLGSLGLGNVGGQLHTPGGIIRQSGYGWTVTNR